MSRKAFHEGTLGGPCGRLAVTALCSVPQLILQACAPLVLRLHCSVDPTLHRSLVSWIYPSRGWLFLGPCVYNQDFPFSKFSCLLFWAPGRVVYRVTGRMGFQAGTVCSAACYRAGQLPASCFAPSMQHAIFGRFTSRLLYWELRLDELQQQVLCLFDWPGLWCEVRQDSLWSYAC